MTNDQAMHGEFVQEGNETWYRIDGHDQAPPFFVALASDSDIWAFISSAGSLSAGRRDAEGAYLPYETVDKIHDRWAHTGPRTWIQIDTPDGPELWEPFAQRLDGRAGRRSLWKNLSGSRLRFREEHASQPLVFQYEWFGSAELGLVRSARIEATGPAAVKLRVLDGVLNLVPPNVSVLLSNTLSCLADAYKWNESHADGRLGLFTLYAQISDRPEPKESFLALCAWHAGLPPGAVSLLSANQLPAFCRGGPVQAETLTRGRRGAWLVQFDAPVDRQGIEWHLGLDGPRTQAEVFDLARRLKAGELTSADVVQARDRNSAGLDGLLARADGLQQSGDAMAAAHHRANVLFNIMRGGVFVSGTEFKRDDLLAFASARHARLGAELRQLAADWPETLDRAVAMQAAQRLGGPQLERLVLAYLPLTFSRRHGDPSRPWNKFSIRVRDAQGRRAVDYQGNWRDIFQNWEALLPSQPEYAGSMIASFLGAMTVDGHNPYRIGRAGIDWEVEDADDPWSHIGYWGDHQVVYLLKLLEAAQDRDSSLIASLWDRALFSFADVPYRLMPHADQVASPRETIYFDTAAHERALDRGQRLGSDGLLVCDAQGEPVLATLGEKLAIILLAKAGTLVPGGGLWLNTQRPEWNDANNALAGTGLSVVSLAQLRRFLAFVLALPCASQGFTLSAATLAALQGLGDLVRATPLSAVDDASARRRYLDQAGALLEAWRGHSYRGAERRQPAQAPAQLLTRLAQDLLPLVDATLQRCRRDDGLFDSYNLVDLGGARAEVASLYPMLEGQVAVLSSGWLSTAQAVALLDTLFDSAIYSARQRSFLLYPDRVLPGFLERNQLDAQALALPVVQRLLADGRNDLLQRQADGVVRFAPALASRSDLEAAGAKLGDELPALCDAYERVLKHHAFTGRSGTMFAYEGLGCIYWHMVAKLLLAVQEHVFAAADQGAPELVALVAHYRRVRDGLGYRKTVAQYGAFPADPYSHTAGEGGAKQPGMTGQVKEEILTRWGELGLRLRQGRVHFDPVLLDAAELPEGGELRFTWARVPYTYRRGAAARLRVRTAAGWVDCPDRSFEALGVLAVEAEVVFNSD